MYLFIWLIVFLAVATDDYKFGVGAIVIGGIASIAAILVRADIWLLSIALVHLTWLFAIVIGTFINSVLQDEDKR